jgi:hypothetical protein
MLLRRMALVNIEKLYSFEIACVFLASIFLFSVLGRLLAFFLLVFILTNIFAVSRRLAADS